MNNLAEIYSDYLIASFGFTTATGLSNLLDGEISHDKITRFLSGKLKTSKDLWHFVKPLIGEIETGAACLIIDNSLEEKLYTDENDLICWHYDHSQQMNVKGINFLSCLYKQTIYHYRSVLIWSQRLKNILTRKMANKSVGV